MLIVIGGEEARPVEHCHQACNQGDSLTDGAELRLTKLVHMVTNATGHHYTLVAKMQIFVTQTILHFLPSYCPKTLCVCERV